MPVEKRISLTETRYLYLIYSVISNEIFNFRKYLAILEFPKFSGKLEI